MTIDSGAPTSTVAATKNSLELAEQRQRRTFSWARLGFGLLGLLLFLAIWQIAAKIKNDPAILPTVPATATRSSVRQAGRPSRPARIRG